MITDVTYARSPSVLHRSVAGDVLLTTAEDESVHRLSGSAGMAWILLESPSTLTELCSDLASTYDVDVQVVTPDIETLVADLVERGWLVATTGTR